MASAEDYASWIVKNQDKKGTPEFDTVAKAYKAARTSTPETKAPPPPPKEPEGIGKKLIGAAAEPMMSMASGAVAAPISGYAGLAGSLLPGPPGQGAEWARKTGDALTYRPRTEGGQDALRAISYPFRKIGEAAHEAGGRVSDVTGSPLAGAAVDTALEAIPQVVARGAGKGITAGGETAAAGLRGGAERLMHAALKPGTKYAKKAEDADQAIDTLLAQGINVTPGGLEKLHARVGDLNDRITTLIESSPAIIDKKKVASRLYDAIDKFQNQVTPQADLAAIDKAWEDFMNHPMFTGKDIPVKAAQEMKKGTYRVLKGKYGEQGSAATEAQKTLARGLKEEIAEAVPKVRQLNAEESKLLQALPMVERRVIVAANKNPIGLGLLAGNPSALLGWMADRSELFKSLVARMLNTAAQGTRAAPNLTSAAVYGMPNAGNQVQARPQ